MVNRVTVKKVVPIEIADPFARKLVGRYIENREGDIAKLQGALRHEDFDTICVTGHNLFGSGSAYGMDEVSRIGANLERAAEEQDAAGVTALIDELASYLRDLKVI